ncbi:MAG: hypothetical protein QXL51_06015 [Candidatus Aenigmatarchaeota archaeon]
MVAIILIFVSVELYPNILLIFCQLFLIVIIGQKIKDNQLYNKARKGINLNKNQTFFSIILIQTFNILVPTLFINENMSYLLLSILFSIAAIFFSAVLYALVCREDNLVIVTLSNNKKINGIHTRVTKEFLYIMKNNKEISINKSCIRMIEYKKINK